MPRLSPTLKTAFALAAVLAAPLLILYFINQYAVNVPYIDEWSFTRVIYAYRQKQLTFGMFLEPHNGHVIAFPRLAMLGLAVIARRWNIIAELYANVVLCLMCVFAWWAILRPHAPQRGRRRGHPLLVAHLLAHPRAQLVYGFPNHLGDGFRVRRVRHHRPKRGRADGICGGLRSGLCRLV